MLTRTQIESLGIIQDASKSCFDNTSYNLRLGQEHVIIGKGDPEYKDAHSLGIRIPPFGCVLVSTLEWLKMPDGVSGRWGLKIRPALTGLIFQAGPQIEPNYMGKLFGLLFNLSAEERVLDPEQPLWSIDFTSIKGRKPKPHPASEIKPDISIKQFLTPSRLPHGSPGQLFTELQTLFAQATTKAEKREQRLEEQLNELKVRNDKLIEQLNSKKNITTTILLGVFVVALCAFVPLGISKSMYDKDEFVSLIEGRGVLEKLQGAVKSELEAKDSKLQELSKQILALREQITSQNKIPNLGLGGDPTKSSKESPQSTNGQDTQKTEGAK